MPRDFNWRTMRWMSTTEIGSMPANGSSSSMKRGFAASARAISTRRRSPPDRLTPFWPAMCADLQVVEQGLQLELAPVVVEVRAQFEDREDVVADAQAPEHRGFLRQVTDAEACARVHRQLVMSWSSSGCVPASAAIRPTTM